ncbi:L7Ae/L30e/S12e/Gadd45 family ribosomal protein [Marinisporobacter balticus]|uniref:Ribosomal protein L7Ae-like RNA K-turn-binding protein n=1 Tax=Marinisporobacter balticus TaxID=2018667 RepID=A0A4R2KYZ6_9FIRM|nr:ribosomal L7Ae/L30e/S12e/Gadd45 family protein [Marinisporobacter balticus]TCO79901.1 ribosomal protein L7Ae-like RNA K-turn-binding protein [Marinisporobacter balticus]
MENKIFSFLGLAQRSGNLVTGEDTCIFNIKKNAVKLVIVANDASNNTKKKFQDVTGHKNVKFIIYGEKKQLSHAVGKINRTVYGIKDEAFANKLFSLIKDCLNNLGGE